MNIKVRPNKSEGGITLIALIIMIIILVILAAVTIRGITGHEGILDSSSEITLLVILAAVTLRGISGQDGILGSTTTAVQRYSIEEYREKIAETAQKTILESAILRRRSKY